MKVVFLSDTPMIKSHYKDMYVYQIGNKYDYDILDLSPWMSPHLNYRSMVDNHTIQIEDKESFIKYLNICLCSSEKIIFVCTMLIRKYGVLYPFIKKYGFKTVCIDKESYGIWMRHRAFFRNRDELSCKNYIKACLQHFSITRRIIYRIRNQNVKYDYKLSCYNYFPENCSKHIRIHHTNYDESVQLIPEHKLDLGRYALFIDTALVDHPAYQKMNIHLDKQRYYLLLNRYFDEFEKANRIKIIIAGYPKVRYKDDVFGGRDVIYNDTASLINNAEVILSHTSSSIITAIIKRKPIIFLHYREMMKEPLMSFGFVTKELAKMLSQPFYDLQTLNTNILKPIEEKYQLFESQHIMNDVYKNVLNETLILNFLDKYKMNEI